MNLFAKIIAVILAHWQPRRERPKDRRPNYERIHLAPPPLEEMPHLTNGDDRNCWCHPDMIFEYEGREIWVHKGNGEELPPADVVAQCIADVIANR